MQNNMRGRRTSRKSNSSDSMEIQNENSTLTQRKYNVQYNEMNSSDTDQKGKRKRCISKNAVMARMNRLRKKKYLESLQSNFAAVSEENVKLKDIVNRQAKLVRALKHEILYLRNVVANSKELGMLLKSVSHNTGLPARSSLLKTEFKPEPEHQPTPEPETNVDVNLENFPLDTRSSSRASESDLQSDDTNFDLFPINSDLLPIQDVILSSSMPNDNLLDELLSSDNAGSDLIENDCANMMDMNCSAILNGSTTLNGPSLLNGATTLNDPAVVNCSIQSKAVSNDMEPFADVGVCLHVAQQKVSLEFCSRCNKNANRVWEAEVADMCQ